MEIIAHRGFWDKADDQNTLDSFIAALSHGFGIETDLRDFNGEIVISHDVPSAASLSMEDFINEYVLITEKYDNSPNLALNIKSDGLQDEVKKILTSHNISNYFFFDMSVPDTLGFIKSNLKLFTRRSEFEDENKLIDQADGIWLDQFHGIWFNFSLINDYLNRGKKVCVVSPELHRREFKEFWTELRENITSDHENIMICTDYPIEAERFFNE